jgi:hypothetical protein
MLDDDLLAVAMDVMPRMQDPAMQGVVAYDYDLLRAGPMARPHLMSNGRLRLRGLNTFLRRCGGLRCAGIPALFFPPSAARLKTPTWSPAVLDVDLALTATPKDTVTEMLPLDAGRATDLRVRFRAMAELLS